ncbi:type II toxin-antitoxin system RelE/ParE family toxin [Hymenobacter aquaticus]|uniref:Type II toxin-antitoxin system RelE/ParE family toxin n=1 Tax=Hymenobacter aquaticus TaxID=1867101 RepID=A0A4Z0Q449_9BACT|nr:type II toxin-antitoxin system RelE/ParE family toxin [Hymenobacter aquaticus]TGE24256.1 type II toxin-antitoxin system RelE/ParE family toxin [Hymenobacter aquaticus]
MQKPIAVALTEEADAFVLALAPEVRKRFAKAFEKTELGFKGDWFQKMTNTADIWEFRVDGPNHTYRLFAFWDTTGATDTLIICTHGLDKKTQKTPAADIARAERVRQAWLAGRR